MATFPLDLSNCNVPGADGFDFHHYGMHPYEVLRVWRPTGWDTTGFKSKSFVVYVHGGAGTNQGNQGLNLSASGYIKTLLETYGLPVVTVDYPPTEYNADHKRTPANARLWPAYLYSVARAISYLKTNAAGTAIAEVLWGLDGNGDPNTVDAEGMILCGFSHGACIAGLIAAVPSSVFALSGDMPLGRPGFHYAATPKPRAIVMEEGQIDWTQFTFDPTQVIGTYRDNRLQLSTYYEDAQEWGPMYGGTPGTTTTPAAPIPEWVKRDMSPWWWAALAPPEIKNVAICGIWPKNQSTDPNQSNLTHLDWDPGTPRLEEDLGKAWHDPHHFFQAKRWGDLLTSLGVVNRIIWGDIASNPSGFNRTTYEKNTATLDFLENVVGVISL